MFRQLSDDTRAITIHKINYKLQPLKTEVEIFILLLQRLFNWSERLCGLVVRVSGYRYRGLGFDSRRYQIF